MLIPFVQDLCHVPEHKRNCFRQESIRFLHSEVSSWWIVLTLKEVTRQLNFLDLIIKYIQPNTHSREVCVKYHTKSKMNVLCQTLQGCTTRSGQWQKISSFWEPQPRTNVLWFSGLRNMYFQNSMLDGVPSSDHSLLERHGLAEHNLLLEKIVLPGEQPKLFFQELGSSIEISCSLPKNVQLWMKFFAWTLCPDLEKMCLLWIVLLRNGVRLASNQDHLMFWNHWQKLRKLIQFGSMIEFSEELVCGTSWKALALILNGQQCLLLQILCLYDLIFSPAIDHFSTSQTCFSKSWPTSCTFVQCHTWADWHMLQHCLVCGCSSNYKWMCLVSHCMQDAPLGITLVLTQFLFWK